MVEAGWGGIGEGSRWVGRAGEGSGALKPPGLVRPVAAAYVKVFSRETVQDVFIRTSFKQFSRVYHLYHCH